VDLRGVGLVIFLVFTVVTGWIAKGLIGRSLIRWAESLVERMPVIRTIYNGSSRSPKRSLPRPTPSSTRPVWWNTQGPASGPSALSRPGPRANWRRRLADKGEILSVFLPTTPNPTSGFLLYLPARDVTLLEMKVEDAAKLIISAGLVYPRPRAPVTGLSSRHPR
jgi:uncharacterized membrane protein